MKTHVRALAGPLLLVLAMLAVPVQAQDQEPGITIDEDDLIVYESPYKVGTIEPAKTTMTVRLDKAPSDDVVMNLVASPAGQVTLSKTQLTFTSTAAQTVVITAIDDDVEESLTTTVTITLSADVENEAAEYDDVTGSVLVSVIDNDGADLIITQTGGGTQVTEAAGGRTDTFSVVLGRRPLSDVVVSVTVPANSQADISVLPTSLTFRPSNWNVPQTVTVTVIDDNLAEGAEIKQVRVAVDTSLDEGEPVSSREYLSVSTKTVTVTVVDDDTEAFVVTQSDGKTVTTEADEPDEAGATGQPDDDLAIRLANEPQGNVKVRVASGDTSEFQVRKGTGNFQEAVEFTFTPSNWDTDQTVLLRGVDDDLHDGHQDAPLFITVIDEGSDPVWRGIEDKVTVRNLDNEKSVLVAPTEFELAEGEDDTYTISITLRPEATVTVRIDADDGLSTDKQSVAFTPTEWATPHTVRITATDDDERTGDRTLSITHTIESNDVDYANKASAAPVSVEVTDDELFDLAASNRALQETVDVAGSGDDLVVTWDIGAVEGDPVGVQIWRASSPFAIVASLDDDSARYLAQRFVDEDRDGDLYIVTVYFGPTEQEGRFPPTASLSRVPGYEGLSQAELEALAASTPADGLSPGAWTAIAILGFVVVIVIIVIVVLVARRSPREEEEDYDVRAEEWEQAGWHVEPRPQFVRATREDREPRTPRQEAWSPQEGQWAEPGAPSPQEEWAGEPASDEFEEWDEPAEPRAGGPWPGAQQTFHLTCPQCRHDFDAVGTRPLRTKCPNCGVEGFLR